jgi:hypothetical protein
MKKIVDFIKRFWYVLLGGVLSLVLLLSGRRKRFSDIVSTLAKSEGKVEESEDRLDMAVEDAKQAADEAQSTISAVRDRKEERDSYADTTFFPNR